MLQGIHTMLNPSGVASIIEPTMESGPENNMKNPSAQLYYTISYMHCMSVSLAYNGAGLGTGWGRLAARKMMVEAGFADEHVKDEVMPLEMRGNRQFLVKKSEKAWLAGSSL